MHTHLLGFLDDCVDGLIFEAAVILAHLGPLTTASLFANSLFDVGSHVILMRGDLELHCVSEQLRDISRNA